MLATEADGTTIPEQHAPAHSLEQWSANELMRHIPTLAWMAQKLDHDLRRRIDRLWLPYSDLAASDPRHAPIETELRALCRSLDRVAHVAVRHRGALHPPNELGSRIGWLVSHAVQCLNTADAATFGRRMPSHLFERSNAEPLWAAVLTVIQQVQKLTDLVRAIDPGIDERMYEELVQLREPLPREPMA
jgi:hypothetical protein